MKGFASGFFFFMVTTLFVGLVALSQSNEFLNKVDGVLLGSQLVDQRFHDALPYFNASFRDVVIDSAHQAKCNGVEEGKFCDALEANIEEYSLNASRALYFNNVNASLDGVSLRCDFLFPPSMDYNRGFTLTRNATLNVSSGNVSKIQFVEFTTTLFLNTTDDNFWVLYDAGGEWEYSRVGAC